MTAGPNFSICAKCFTKTPEHSTCPTCGEKWSPAWVTVKIPVHKPTSLRAYDHIKQNGLLPQARFKVYEALVQHGPMTGAELDDVLNSPSAHKRLSELQMSGVIAVARTRRCAVSGLEAAEWHALENVLPQEPDVQVVPKLTRAEIREALAALRRESNEKQKAGKQLDPALIRLGKWLAQRAR